MQYHAENNPDSLEEMLDGCLKSLDTLSSTFDKFWNDVDEWEICQRLEMVSYDLLRVRNESLELLEMVGGL